MNTPHKGSNSDVSSIDSHDETGTTTNHDYNDRRVFLGHVIRLFGGAAVGTASVAVINQLTGESNAEREVRVLRDLLSSFEDGKCVREVTKSDVESGREQRQEGEITFYVYETSKGTMTIYVNGASCDACSEIMHALHGNIFSFDGMQSSNSEQSNGYRRNSLHPEKQNMPIHVSFSSSDIEDITSFLENVEGYANRNGQVDILHLEVLNPAAIKPNKLAKIVSTSRAKHTMVTWSRAGLNDEQLKEWRKHGWNEDEERPRVR